MHPLSPNCHDLNIFGTLLWPTKMTAIASMYAQGWRKKIVEMCCMCGTAVAVFNDGTCKSLKCAERMYGV